MAIFGFICLLVIATCLSLFTAAGLVVSVGLSGKVEPSVWPFAAFCALLWFGVYYFFPFSVALKGGAT